MLKGLFSQLDTPVPPVPSLKNQREPLEPSNLLAVPLVPPVPPEKTEVKVKSEKIATPATDGDRTSEAEHNAQGRFFKFLATWPDGRQCYLCQMPRQTVDEMRAQFPDATHIEPITGEHYDD